MWCHRHLLKLYCKCVGITFSATEIFCTEMNIREILFYGRAAFLSSEKTSVARHVASLWIFTCIWLLLQSNTDSSCNISLQGFMGTNCSEDINECNSSPCGIGNCFNIAGSYSCECPFGYGGPHCQVRHPVRFGAKSWPLVILLRKLEWKQHWLRSFLLCLDHAYIYSHKNYHLFFYRISLKY